MPALDEPETVPVIVTELPSSEGFVPEETVVVVEIMEVRFPSGRRMSKNCGDVKVGKMRNQVKVE